LFNAHKAEFQEEQQLITGGFLLTSLLTYKMIYDILKWYEKLTKKPATSVCYGLPS
jgi:hypothetical protein